jgi:8-oxo-dGTP diphosphatase
MNLFSEKSFRKSAESDGITHITTGIAVVRDGKILIVRRAAADYLGGQYELPGGGVDEGETITESAIRETKEETGLIVSKVITAFDGFDYTTDRKPRVRQINFLVETGAGDVRLNPDEHDRFMWADLDTDLTNLMSDDMQNCVTKALRISNHSHSQE